MQEGKEKVKDVASGMADKARGKNCNNDHLRHN